MATTTTTLDTTQKNEEKGLLALLNVNIFSISKKRLSFRNDVSDAGSKSESEQHFEIFLSKF